jgi:hypothetical protein
MKHMVQFIFILIYFQGFSQVIEAGDKIRLTNTNPDDRKVNDLTFPSSENDAVNLAYLLGGYSNFGQAGINGDTMVISINPSPNQITPGYIINFISPITNSGTTFIKIQGVLGATQLTKHVTINLDPAEIISGQLVTVIYDGVNFQCISPLMKNCPNGYIQAAAEFCVSATEKDSSYFWQAIKTCGNENARICNWSEWYYVCQKTSLGVTDMMGNFEWIDGTGNSLGWTNPPTYYTSAMAGGYSNCTELTSAIVDTTHPYYPRSTPKAFHCCYSLK